MWNGMKVIDADAHMHEPEYLWERYVEPKFRDRVPKVAFMDGLYRCRDRRRVESISKFPDVNNGGIGRQGFHCSASEPQPQSSPPMKIWKQ